MNSPKIQSLDTIILDPLYKTHFRLNQIKRFLYILLTILVKILWKVSPHKSLAFNWRDNFFQTVLRLIRRYISNDYLMISHKVSSGFLKKSVFTERSVFYRFFKMTVFFIMLTPRLVSEKWVFTRITMKREIMSIEKIKNIDGVKIWISSRMFKSECGLSKIVRLELENGRFEDWNLTALWC